MAKEKTTTLHKILTVVGTVLCVLLVPVLLINLTLIAKSYINKDEVPSVGGYVPLIVLTDSMLPVISSGDLIICHTVDPDTIQEQDVISFFDPAGNGTSIVTHRVIEIVEQDGARLFRTRGDNNNTEDKELVSPADVVGIYQDTRIPGAGNVAMFMQTTTGLILCVVLPIVLLVGYDILRRRRYDRVKQDDNAALLAELEALRAQAAATATTTEEQPTEE